MRFFSGNLSQYDDHYASIKLQFERLFAPETLEAAYDSFQWGKVTSTEAATEERNAVAEEFSRWVCEGCEQNASIEAIGKVHKWGFNQDLNKKQKILYQQPYLNTFMSMMKVWHKCEKPAEMRLHLEQCLRTPHVKIARFSKWLCFIDQSKYAIYDSRVSLALRQIKLDGKRVFPTIGSKTKDRPTGASPAGKHMSEVYMLYLDLLHSQLPRTKLTRVADIEMALFMLGVKKMFW